MNKSIKLLMELKISKKIPLILGCSGGPDSMCLLHLLSKNGYTVICAHVDHNIRPSSKDECEMLRLFCQNNHIQFEYIILEKAHHNEAYYRTKRYDFYKMLANKYDTKYILTAHHGDDLMETILMRLTRGSYLKGYGGFQKCYEENNYTFIKPLIYYTKEDILKYNETNNIPYVIDSTNNDLTFTRNKYRHKILPEIKELNANVHQKYLQFSEEIYEAESYIYKETKKHINDNFKNNILDLKKFLVLDPYIQKKEIEQILKNIYKNDVDKLKVFHIDSILFLLAKEKNFKLDLPLGIKVIKEYDEMIFKYREEPVSYCLKFEQNITLSSEDQIIKVNSSNDTSNNTIYLYSKDIKLPLYIRTRKKHDKIAIKNMKGHKKIKNLFIDEKVPESKRDTYPLLVDSDDTILWIPGLRKSKFDNDNREKCDIILKYIKKGDKTNENEKNEH